MPFKKFKLDPNILKAIDESGYTTPSPIQAEAIPIILAGKDLIASAQTGTGKTAAFVLPTLQYLIANPSKNGKPRVLILTPTRELAQQVEASAKKYGKYMRFTAASIVGGMPYRQQFRQLSRPLDMIIATPGRFMDIMERPNSIDLSQVKVLILDEADRMLDMGFIDDVHHIAKHLEKASRQNERQTLLFSATLDSRIGKLSKNLLSDPETVEITPPKSTHTQIEQRLYIAHDVEHKNKILDHILENESIHQAIIFSATKRHADSFAAHLRKLGHEAVAMHGDMKQSQRIRTLDQLRSGKIQFLVATDVAARGIDVRGISHVINYDIPRTGEDYTHRIGRTGRAGETGDAITLALVSEGAGMQRIEREIGASIKQYTIPGEPPVSFRRGGGSKPKGGRKFGGFSEASAKAKASRKRDGSNKSRFNKNNDRDGKYNSPSPSRFAKSDYAKPDYSKPDYAKKSKPKYATANGNKKSKHPVDGNRASFGHSNYSKPDYAKPHQAKKRFDKPQRATNDYASQFAQTDYVKHKEPAKSHQPKIAVKKKRVITAQIEKTVPKKIRSVKKPPASAKTLQRTQSKKKKIEE